MDNNVADNDYMNLIAFGDEPTFVEEFGTFTANLVSRIVLIFKSLVVSNVLNKVQSFATAQSFHRSSKYLAHFLLFTLTDIIQT